MSFASMLIRSLARLQGTESLTASDMFTRGSSMVSIDQPPPTMYSFPPTAWA
jgi:hypothetical protein